MEIKLKGIEVRIVCPIASAKTLMEISSQLQWIEFEYLGYILPKRKYLIVYFSNIWG